MNNKTSSLSLKHIGLLLDSLQYCLSVDTDLSLSKANMKDIIYKPLCTTEFLFNDLLNHHRERNK
ncbi:hypothetical protein H8356DRAFT_1329013 [Neocallimastix lanati (nom. inval.)]|nr:hypothetical protein H8356DRAFT_1329013 [Neocallimastix sp. JGI-2020a]